MTTEKCPKCGSELPLEEGWDSMVYHCKKCHVVIDADTGEACEIVHLETLYERGHEEKCPESENFMLLGWDPREIVWLTKRIRSRLLAFSRLTIKGASRFLDWVLNRSKFKDPRYARINGRWVKVDNTEDLIGQLEELQQEASR